MKHFLVFISVIAILLPLSSLKAEESDMDKLSLLLGASNAGTEFLMTFHPGWGGNEPPNPIRIYVASLFKTKVTLRIPALDITIVKETIPNDVIEFSFTQEEAQVYHNGAAGTIKPPPSQVWENRAIIVTADDPIICYGVSRTKHTSDGYMALPRNVLGRDYQIASFADPANNLGQFFPSYTSIVGAYDNTSVKFKLGGFESMLVIMENGDTLRAGESMTRTLNIGDVWLIAGVGKLGDLTGSNINADKPVAVISGNYCSMIPTKAAACDYIIEQELPIYNWGKDYLVASVIERRKASIVKIFAAEDNTKFSFDDIPAGTIQNAGGFLHSGYIEMRATLDSIPKPVRISSDKTINVVLFNPGQADDGVESDPFQMQILPIGQYQTDAIFNTPGIRGGLAFRENYINIVFMANADGSIPDDLKFTKVIDGGLDWTPLKNLITDAQPFYGEEKDGRQYYAATLKLDFDGVYRMTAYEPFAVYSYGYDSYDSYGFPASGMLLDMSSKDIVAPEIKYEVDENFNISGIVRDVSQLSGKVGKDGDEVQESQATGLSSVKLINALSDNYKLDNTPFIPGIDNETSFQLKVIDKSKSAKAIFAVTDRRGNDKIVEFNIVASPILNLVFNTANFGSLKSGKFVELEFILTNQDTNNTVPINSIVLEKNDLQFEIMNNIEANRVFQAGEQHKFKVRFSARNMNEDDIKNIEGAFSNQIGIELANGEIHYFSTLSAAVANPRVVVSGIDFTAQLEGEPAKSEFVVIKNLGIVDMLVTGFEVNGNPEFTFDLPSVSEEKPITIRSGREYRIKTSFVPTEPGDYSATMKVISDAYVINDVAQIRGLAIPAIVIDDKLEGGKFAVNYDGAAITFRSEHDATISGMKVYDLNGRTLFTSELTNSVNSYSAAVPGLTSGIYLLHLKINGIWMSKKIII
ncbi:MAG: hypothetical protein CVV22_02580 [Ignavibacteriae bacterium HGW-Ignavibacteriae-1]|jgi:hypothetical protein|nr:MAG: hypothetical protein CVV22_02580 [Ignavibacteriae bacterium HGW-Ignavibacteriae-1]